MTQQGLPVRVCSMCDSFNCSFFSFYFFQFLEKLIGKINKTANGRGNNSQVEVKSVVSKHYSSKSESSKTITKALLRCGTMNIS